MAPRLPVVALSAFTAAVLAEFVGTFIFQLVGGSERSPVYNGLVLTVVVYMTCQVSGGVVNPAVATALFAAGEIGLAKYVAYVAAELLGATAGALVAGTIDPDCFEAGEGLHDHELATLRSSYGCVGSYGPMNTGPGCVPDVTPDAYYRVFLWEAVGAFVLVRRRLRRAA